jgi:hypothetical protein
LTHSHFFAAEEECKKCLTFFIYYSPSEMADESEQDRMETGVGAGAEEEGPLVAMARQFELQMNEIIGLIAAPDRPQRKAKIN